MGDYPDTILESANEALARGSASAYEPPRRVRQFMRSRLSVVYEHDTVAFASQILLWRGLQQLPVVDGASALIGVVTAHGLLERALDPMAADAPVRLVMTAAHVVDADASVEDACKRLVDGHLDCLVVVRQGAIEGLFTSADALRASSSAAPARREGPTAEDVMVQPRFIARAADTVAQVVGPLAQRVTRHVPVVYDDGRVAGVVKESEVRAAIGDLQAASECDGGASLASMSVLDVMSAACCVLPDAPLDVVAERLVAERRDVVLVTSLDDRLLGLVSSAELIRYFTACDRIR
jgi:CBS domain-containing protein